MSLISSKWFWICTLLVGFFVLCWPTPPDFSTVQTSTNKIVEETRSDTLAEIVAILSNDKPVSDQHKFWYIANKIYGTSQWFPEITYRQLARLVYIESRGDSLAVSSVGAVGLGQVRPEIWAGEFPQCGDALRRVRDNLCYTAHILDHYKKRSPDLHTALLLYNGCKSKHCEWYARAVADDD